MATKNNKTKLKIKATTNSKAKLRKRKRKKVKKVKSKLNSNLLLIVTFFAGVLLIVASYAWLSQSLNVKVKFFNLQVSTDNGLFISLNGRDFSDSVEISLDSVINDLRTIYPNHTNQWSNAGLWPVSSNGIKDSSQDKFAVYMGEVSRFKYRKTNRKFLNTRLFSEDNYSSANAYIAFDLFLKNVSGSPKNDNLYLDEASINFAENTEEEIVSSMSNIMNSMRFGIVKIGSTSSKSDLGTIQNIRCNNNCQMIIYEPNGIAHSSDSIEKAIGYGVVLVDGVYIPTYAVISDGEYLDHATGQEGSGIPLDTEHFALQNTIREFETPIFQIPNGVTKFRVYVWIEGQDMDSLETHSKGAAIDIAINFVKDLAGYN